MKNIHVLPTDKPSRLCKSKITQKLSMTDVLSFYGDGTYNQHIYVTSDEEVKEGDWFIMSGFILRKCDYVDNYMIIDTTQGKHFFSVCKKIILTTDQDLIKDGVQAIDDEFLEWFVENPTCEEVEVEDYYNPTNMVYGINTSPYKIIIPQEEPKQETLEEAAERFYPLSKGGSMWMPSADDCNKANKQEGFIEGAKSDAARDYWFEQFKKNGGDK
jgi:hypothetical protein